MQEKVPYWDRSSVRGPNGEKVVAALPAGSQKVAAWDKAGTEYVPKLNNTDADFTACMHMAKCKDGYFYMYGNYCPENFDQHEQVYGKFRKAVGERDRIMLKQAEYDGKDVPVLISRDAGSDGGQVFQEMAKKFVSAGFKAVPSTTPVTQSKWSKFEPFLMACQAGLVKVVESSFDSATLEMIYKELETFAPTLPNGKPWRSGRRNKDDVCDAIAEAYNWLSQKKIYTVPKLTVLNDPTIKKTLDL